MLRVLCEGRCSAVTVTSTDAISDWESMVATGGLLVLDAVAERPMVFLSLFFRPDAMAIRNQSSICVHVL